MINKIIFITTTFAIVGFSKNLSNVDANLFISLLKSGKNLSQFVNKNDLKISNRFGISYKGIQNKFLISYNFNQEILSDKLLTYKIDTIDNSLSKLSIDFASYNKKADFYFLEGKLISQMSLQSQKFKVVNSKYFKFLISNEHNFNKENIITLENYVNKTGKLLNFSSQDYSNLKKNKIIYILCNNENEVEKLTGFNTAGMYELAYDRLITCHNNHQHELAHFLINFKLKQLPLYTLPFLQEGFAVAIGGRSGRSPETILNSGLYIIRSGFQNPKEILNISDFKNADPSISYPVSGFYADYFLKRYGINSFIDLYKKYSYKNENQKGVSIDTSDFRFTAEWNNYLGNYAKNLTVNPVNKIDTSVTILKNANYEIYEGSHYYYFKIKDYLSICDKTVLTNYNSTKFYELFPNKSYNGEKYIIKANENEISVYNLYTNTLVVNYVANFTIPTQKLYLDHDSFLYFSIKKDVFDKSFNSQIFK